MRAIGFTGGNGYRLVSHLTGGRTGSTFGTVTTFVERVLPAGITARGAYRPSLPNTSMSSPQRSGPQVPGGLRPGEPAGTVNR